MEEDKPKSKRKKKETAGERKPRSAQRDALHAKNWKEYMATVEDIQNFLMDRILLRHNVITGRVEYRLPVERLFLYHPVLRPPLLPDGGEFGLATHQ